MNSLVWEPFKGARAEHCGRQGDRHAWKPVYEYRTGEHIGRVCTTCGKKENFSETEHEPPW